MNRHLQAQGKGKQKGFPDITKAWVCAQKMEMHDALGELEVLPWCWNKEFRVPWVGQGWCREKATEQVGMKGPMDHVMESNCILQAIGSH